MSLWEVHYSYTSDFVSHPNNHAQKLAHAGRALNHEETVSRVAGLLKRLVRRRTQSFLEIY